MPYWLAAGERCELRLTIGAVLDGAATTGADDSFLRAVLTELALAPVRDRVWPAMTAVARCAAGYSDDVLPIRLSGAERGAVLSLTGLSGAVLSALNDGPRAL
ncbi:MAG: hypothetical protein H0V67_02985 [Geodermatophilaceae bacterium]|nr:hypothetical protein [Geodermatophilaceae bacterium]